VFLLRIIGILTLITIGSGIVAWLSPAIGATLSCRVASPNGR
jgi:hypothetical protein